MTTTAVSPDVVADLAAEDLAPGRAVTLLQRVLMPRGADPRKVRALYLDEVRSEKVHVASRSTGTSRPVTRSPSPRTSTPSRRATGGAGPP